MNYIKDYFRAYGMIWKANPMGFVFQLLMQGLLAGIPVLVLFFTKQLLDQVLLAKTLDANILHYLFLMAGVYVLNLLVQQIQSYLSFNNQHQVSAFFSEKILNKSTKIPFEFNENSDYQNSLHLAQQQSLYKIPQVYQVLQSVLVSSFSLLALVSYFFKLLSDFAWWIVLLAIPLSVIKWISGNALAQLDKKLVRQERESNYLHQLLLGVSYAKEVKTLNMGAKWITQFSVFKAFIFQKKRSLQLKISFFSGLAELLEVAVIVMVMYQLIDLAIAKVIGISVLVIYLQGLQRIQSTLKTFLQSWVQLLQQRVFLKDLFDYLDLKEEKREIKYFDKYLTHELEVEGLSFKYPESDHWVLKNIDFKIKKGETIAIVGANGSGKSTLVKLLAGLYIPTQGDLRWKNRSIHQIDEGLFANESTFVFQDFEKYYVSIQEFIEMGCQEEEMNREDRLLEALQMADAQDFVHQFPHKHHSKLGRIFGAGVQLSGGQWQKLVIARAFFRNSPLWIFDEPTSSIDAIAEAKIIENIKAKSEDKVSIIITHRLYNLKFVDKILVMDQGEIVEQGTFDELKTSSVIFNQLYEQQKV
ncbi:ABC transporter ATP-binding protein [Aquirufa sp. ROCK-SH2]